MAAARTKQPQNRKKIKRIKCVWEWGVLPWGEHLDLVTKIGCAYVARKERGGCNLTKRKY